jgi:glutamyl-tRNA synthetase
MQQVPPKQKVTLVLPFLQRAGYIPLKTPCEVGPKLTRIVEAAGDRIKVAGDILNYADFFTADDQLVYDEAAFDKRVRVAGAKDLLAKYAAGLATHQASPIEPFDAASLEAYTKRFVETEHIQLNDIIHVLRVAVTGKGVGLGLFDTLAIVGRESSLRRIELAIERATP